MTDDIAETLSIGMHAATQHPMMQLSIITQAVGSLAKVAEVAHMVAMDQDALAERFDRDNPGRQIVGKKADKNTDLRDAALQRITDLLATIKNEPAKTSTAGEW